MQTTMTDAPAAGLAGMIADTGNREIVSRIVEDAGGIAPGTFVTKGTADYHAAQIDAAGDVSSAGVLLGVAVLDTSRAPGTPQYAQNDQIPILRKGRIWVQSETAQAYGATPYIRHATSVNGSIVGLIRNDADTISTVDKATAAPAGVRVVSTLAAAGLCLVEINLP